MLVRELLIRLGFTTDTKGADAVDKKVNDIRGSADRAASSLFEMAGAFALFAGAIQITKVADEMQSLEARIGMLPQTIKEAGSAFEDVAARASAARQGIRPYAELYTKIGNAAKDYLKTQNEVLTITDTLSKALVVGGATAQEQASAMLQFAQGIGSGVLQGEELRAMAEASPMFMDELANAIGIPRAELKKFASDGKLTSKTVLDGVAKMASVFDAKFKTMPMTVGSATTIIGNRWATFINRMNRESSAITTIANTFLAAFDKIETGLNWVIDKLGGGSNAMRVMAIVLGTILLPVILSATASLWAMIAPVLPLIAAMVLLGLAIEDVYVWVQGGDSVMGRWFGKFSEYSKYIDMMKTAFYGVKEVVMGLIDNLSTMLRVMQAVLTLDFSEAKAQFDSLGRSEERMRSGINALVNGGNKANQNGMIPFVSPQSMSPNAPAYAAGSTFNVNVAVPAGTSQQQAAEVQRQLSQPATEQKLSRYLTGG